VSRQREWLADASSVQFTRQTVGLEGAFKKIGGLPTGSRLDNAHGASQVSHMLFGEGGRSFSQLFATHPPLFERIKALDPSFDPAELQHLAQQWQSAPPNGLAEDAARGLVAAPIAPPRVPAAGRIEPAAVTARVGTLTAEDLAHGAGLSARIPARFRQDASQPSTAVPLILAMLLNTEPEVRDRQLGIVRSRIGADTADAAERLSGELAELAPELRLPVLALAVPLITARPPASLAALLAALDELARADGRITLFEYCLTRLVASYVQDAGDPAGRSKPGRGGVAGARDAALTLLAALAAAGNDDPAQAAHAFAGGLAALLPGESVPYAPPADTWRALDAGWVTLDAVAPPHKQRLVHAMVVAVRDDGVLTLHEAELLRTACALLHCPLPAFVA